LTEEKLGQVQTKKACGYQRLMRLFF